ncbi:MAG: cytochrome C biogenesis protein [Actinomycetales bacterium]|nr:cytochrome C biogenesis protein [Actinomycetales bacterium]
MLLLLGAIVAGVLTTLAPCVLPMLPVIVGGSLGPSTAQARRRAYVITVSLGLSIIVFTLILKASTALIGIPSSVWQWISGGILILLGLVSLFPALWDRISAALRLQERSTSRLASARQQQGTTGAVLTGAALGPVFSSCSPMYGYVIVTVLPASFAQGMVLLLGYVVGLCVTLLAIALLGQRFIGNARWAADPHSWFRRGLGLVFILVGVAIAFGFDKDIQTWVIENSPIAPWQLDSGFIPGQ